MKISRYSVIPSALTFGTLGIEIEMRGGYGPKFAQNSPCVSESNDNITSMGARRIAEDSR